VESAKTGVAGSLIGVLLSACLALYSCIGVYFTFVGNISLESRKPYFSHHLNSDYDLFNLPDERLQKDIAYISAKNYPCHSAISQNSEVSCHVYYYEF
jgi:hypothetical protein